MSKRIEVRATINHAGLAVGQKAMIDPELPYMKMCLEAGHLVPTGREVSVPSQSPTGAVRPPAAPVVAVKREAAPAQARKRTRKPKKATPPS